MYSTQSRKCSFSNPRGHRLDARLDQPKGVDSPLYAIISHCFTCTKETLTTSRISRGLAQLGVNVLRFDFTGLGASEGDFADTNFTTMVEDILSAADYLAQHHTPACALIGHSMGGTSAILASTRIDSCKTVITVASPSEPAHVLHHFGPAMNRLESGQAAEISVAGVQYPVKPQFVDDVHQVNMHQQLTGYSKSILAIRAGDDALVNYDDADDIVAYTQGVHQLLDIAEADHLFREREHSDLMIREIQRWINQYC